MSKDKLPDDLEVNLERDGIDQLFRDGAVLTVFSDKTGRIEIGNCHYYFTMNPKPVERTGFFGDNRTDVVSGYDGWRRGL